MIDLKKGMKIAIVGASVDPEKYGNKIVKVLSEKGFNNLFPINLEAKEIEGFKVFKNLSELTVRPDIINFVVPPQVTLKVLQEVKELNFDNVWFQPGSFNDAVIEKVKAFGLNYIAGDCIMVAASMVRN